MHLFYREGSRSTKEARVNTRPFVPLKKAKRRHDAVPHLHATSTISGCVVYPSRRLTLVEYQKENRHAGSRAPSWRFPRGCPPAGGRFVSVALHRHRCGRFRVSAARLHVPVLQSGASPPAHTTDPAPPHPIYMASVCVCACVCVVLCRAVHFHSAFELTRTNRPKKGSRVKRYPQKEEEKKNARVGQAAHAEEERRHDEKVQLVIR